MSDTDTDAAYAYTVHLLLIRLERAGFFPVKWRFHDIQPDVSAVTKAIVRDRAGQLEFIHAHEGRVSLSLALDNNPTDEIVGEFSQSELFQKLLFEFSRKPSVPPPPPNFPVLLLIMRPDGGLEMADTCRSEMALDVFRAGVKELTHAVPEWRSLEIPLHLVPRMFDLLVRSEHFIRRFSGETADPLREELSAVLNACDDSGASPALK